MRSLTLKICAGLGMGSMLLGCTATLKDYVGAALKIENASHDALIGTYKYEQLMRGGITTLDQYFHTNLAVKNPNIDCAGEAKYEMHGVSNFGPMNPVTLELPIHCSTGQQGSINILFDKRGGGIGQGKLDDGTQVKLLLGDISGTLAW